MVRRPGQQHEQQRFKMVDRNEICTLERHWKTTDYKIWSQIKKLESVQAELLKTFDGHQVDVKSYLAQKKPVPVENAYQCFFETYDGVKKNRQQQRQLLKPKYLESFDGVAERKLGEKKKTLEWLVEQITKLRKIERYCNTVCNPRKYTLRLYTMSENCESISREADKSGRRVGIKKFRRLPQASFVQ